MTVAGSINLAGKVALVTGAGRGIGKGCAIQLARRGADIVLNDRPGSPDLEATADEIRLFGRTCRAIEADVFSRADCERLLNATLTAFTRIGILVSNPAYRRRVRFLDYSPHEFEKTINGTPASGSGEFQVGQFVGWVESARPTVSRLAIGGPRRLDPPDFETGKSRGADAAPLGKVSLWVA